jgi:hypothetical protein
MDTHYTAIFVLLAQYLWLLWYLPGSRLPATLANVGAALDAVIAVEQGDDMAYSNGSYDRAMQVLLDATRVLTDALREESAE